jgi:hypothetical protein
LSILQSQLLCATACGKITRDFKRRKRPELNICYGFNHYR